MSGLLAYWLLTYYTVAYWWLAYYKLWHTDGCILYFDQRRPFVSSSARRLKQVDSVARLGAIQVNPVETLQGETREVRAVEKALEVNDGIELNVVDNPAQNVHTYIHNPALNVMCTQR